ncbi:MAG TPA: substrate-binding domain-containing protein, partial [Pseudonocardiaceae bacterium]|nr:substrate-binding domain-containing protein [Pseudonocardiaceae bacterium]
MTSVRVRRLGALLAASTALAAAAAVGPGTPMAFADETIYGSGSSWSANAMDQWIADIASKGVPVQFNVSSSGQGRGDFAQNQNDFANSDIPYQGTDPLTHAQDTNLGRAFAYMPIVAGGTALMYHLQRGNDLIRNVRLSGQTIVKIFTGRITSWDDPAITADMNGQALPAKKIQVVVESNGSGTTAQFTDWMTKQYPALWGSYEGVNPAVPTSYYPVNASNITAQNGDAQVAQTITSSGY